MSRVTPERRETIVGCLAEQGRRLSGLVGWLPDYSASRPLRMRAAVCHAFGEPLVIEEIEIAAASRGEVEVELAACAICQSDIHYAQGAWGGTLPAVYGHEAAGTVSGVGPGVEGSRSVTAWW